MKTKKYPKPLSFYMSDGLGQPCITGSCDGYNVRLTFCYQKANHSMTIRLPSDIRELSTFLTRSIEHIKTHKKLQRAEQRRNR